MNRAGALETHRFVDDDDEDDDATLQGLFFRDNGSLVIPPTNNAAPMAATPAAAAAPTPVRPPASAATLAGVQSAARSKRRRSLSPKAYAGPNARESLQVMDEDVPGDVAYERAKKLLDELRPKSDEDHPKPMAALPRRFAPDDTMVLEERAEEEDADVVSHGVAGLDRSMFVEIHEGVSSIESSALPSTSATSRAPPPAVATADAHATFAHVWSRPDKSNAVRVGEYRIACESARMTASKKSDEASSRTERWYARERDFWLLLATLHVPRVALDPRLLRDEEAALSWSDAQALAVGYATSNLFQLYERCLAWAHATASEPLPRAEFAGESWKRTRRARPEAPSFDPDAPARDGLALEEADAAEDAALCATLLWHMRRGAFHWLGPGDPSAENPHTFEAIATCVRAEKPWRAASCLGSRPFVLDKLTGVRSGNAHRSTWKNACRALVATSPQAVDSVECAVYAALSGDLTALMQSAHIRSSHDARFWALFKCVTEAHADAVLCAHHRRARAVVPAGRPSSQSDDADDLALASLNQQSLALREKQIFTIMLDLLAKGNDEDLRFFVAAQAGVVCGDFDETTRRRLLEEAIAPETPDDLLQRTLNEIFDETMKSKLSKSSASNLEALTAETRGRKLRFLAHLAWYMSTEFERPREDLVAPQLISPSPATTHIVVLEYAKYLLRSKRLQEAVTTSTRLPSNVRNGICVVAFEAALLLSDRQREDLVAALDPFASRLETMQSLAIAVTRTWQRAATLAPDAGEAQCELVKSASPSQFSDERTRERLNDQLTSASETELAKALLGWRWMARHAEDGAAATADRREACAFAQSEVLRVGNAMITRGVNRVFDAASTSSDASSNSSSTSESSSMWRLTKAVVRHMERLSFLARRSEHEGTPTLEARSWIVFVRWWEACFALRKQLDRALSEIEIDAIAQAASTLQHERVVLGDKLRRRCASEAAGLMEAICRDASGLARSVLAFPGGWLAHDRHVRSARLPELILAWTTLLNDVLDVLTMWREKWSADEPVVREAVREVLKEVVALPPLVARESAVATGDFSRAFLKVVAHSVCYASFDENGTALF